MESGEIRQIIDFVEGRLEPKQLEQALYENPRFEEVLNSDLTLYEGLELYIYAIQQNFNDPGAVYNLHDALTRFLKRRQISVQPTKTYGNFYRLLLAAQPEWLDVDPIYIQREMMPAAGDLAGQELKQWLRAEFLKRFTYIAKPPHWIQSPRWPIGKNGPLAFFGQIQVKDYFHDEAAVYVFYDPISGEYENIRQTY